MVHWALPIASTRCPQSLQSDLSLLLWKLNEWDAVERGHTERAITIMTPAPLVTLPFRNVLKHNAIVPLESYWLSCWKTPWRFMLYNVWRAWTNLNGKKMHFLEMAVPWPTADEVLEQPSDALTRTSSWNIKEYFFRTKIHLLWTWDSWKCLLMKIIKGKGIFTIVYLILDGSKMALTCIA